MAVCNGSRFLDAQLASLAAQTWTHINICASDDGSSDQSWAILKYWKQRWAKGHFSIIPGPQRGFSENFGFLLSQRTDGEAFMAFCDQDDVWDHDKLEVAIAQLDQSPKEPSLYCSRTRLVDKDGIAIGHSPPFSRPPSFRNAIVQSIAGANTMVFNRAAFELVAEASRRTPFVSHDWWSYIVVTGTGGRVTYSLRPTISYRQHGANQVGANMSLSSRLRRLARLFSGQFKVWTDLNLAGLQAIDDMLTTDARIVRDTLVEARRSGVMWRAIRTLQAGIYRQTIGGNITLAGAVLFRRI
jgi:glycosyltransferase involved in cell wall biosynthesis